jgi:hypothetical protein
MAKDLSHSELISLSKNKAKLKVRIAEVTIENKDLTPYIYHSPIKCLTCKATDGASHPITSYCFYCDTDNWS